MAIGVSPEKLEFNLKQSETASSRYIFIQNLDQNQAKIKVSAANFQNWVKINPAEAMLQAQQTETVEVTVSGKKNFETHLEILAAPTVTADFQVLSGLKLPLTVKVENSFGYYLNFLIPLLLIFAVLGVAYYLKQRKKTIA